MNIHESAENYLETIYIINQNRGSVRSVDVANALEYSRPSVSVAMKNLREQGYICMESDGHITLSDDGLKIAEAMYERHTLISDWLIFLGVNKETAVNDACKMEHALSEQSFNAIKNHLENWKKDINGSNGPTNIL